MLAKNNLDEEVDYLINLLHKTALPMSKEVIPTILNNLVYYTPRIQSRNQLKCLIESIFNCHNEQLININNPSQLFTMIKSIFQWKLQISEPIININTFYALWNEILFQCQNWNIIKLVILAGILSTRDLFNSLQKKLFLDGDGTVEFLYDDWRYKYFMPLWLQFAKNSSKISINTNTYKEKINKLIQIYSFISIQDDLQIVPDTIWNKITDTSIDIISKYMRKSINEKEIDMSAIARLLQLSIQRTNKRILQKFVEHFQFECQNLSKFEMNSDMPNKSYSGEYYSNILLTMVLSFKNIMEVPSVIGDHDNIVTCCEMLCCLFYLNFITLDFGIVGFQSYEMLYEMLTVALTINPQGIKLYPEKINDFRREINYDLKYPNKINDTRLIFLFNLLEKTMPTLNTNVLEDILYNVVDHLVIPGLHSINNDIREAAHSVILSVLKVDPQFNKGMRKWLHLNIYKYLNLSIDQYLADIISGRQLLIISRTFSGSLPILMTTDHDITRNVLHNIFRRLINVGKSSTPEQQLQREVTLIKCLMDPLPYVDGRFVADWLDNIKELIESSLSHLNCGARDELFESLWDKISRGNNDIAIRWWYIHMVPQRNSVL